MWQASKFYFYYLTLNLFSIPIWNNCKKSKNFLKTNKSNSRKAKQLIETLHQIQSDLNEAVKKVDTICSCYACSHETVWPQKGSMYKYYPNWILKIKLYLSLWLATCNESIWHTYTKYLELLIENVKCLKISDLYNLCGTISMTNFKTLSVLWCCLLSI